MRQKQTIKSHFNDLKLIPLCQALLVAVALILVTACATTPADPSILNNATLAIERAQTAGGDVHATLELRLANRRLAEAEEAIQQGDAQAARYLADQSEIEAQLALARTQAALARLALEDRRQAYERLKEELLALYGEEVLQ